MPFTNCPTSIYWPESISWPTSIYWPESIRWPDSFTGQNASGVQNLPIGQHPSLAQHSFTTAQNPSIGQHLSVGLNTPVDQNPSSDQNPSGDWNPSVDHHNPSAVIPTHIKCVEITPHKQSVRELSGSQINKAELVDPNIVIRKYPSYQSITCVPTLAQRLASQSYFGDDVLRRCTVMGCRDSPALPLRELNLLKQKIFVLFPQFWANPLDFEEIWTRCSIAIGQRCKRLARGLAMGKT